MDKLWRSNRRQGPRRTLTLAKRLQRQLLIMGCLPIIVFGLLIVWLRWNEDYDRVRQLETAQADLISQRVNSYLETAQTTLAQIGLYGDFLSYRASTQQAILQGLKRNNPAFIDVELFNLQGLPITPLSITSTDLASGNRRALASNCFNETISKGFCFGQPYQNPATQLPEIELTRILHDAQGKANGIIALYLDLTYLNQTLNKLEAGSYNAAYIVDEQGHIIATKGQNLGDFPSVTFNDNTKQLLQQITDSKSNAQATYTGLQNTEVLGAASLIPLLGWKTVIEIPTSEIYRSVGLEVGLILIVLAGTILSWLVYARFFGRHLARPLAVLSQAAHQVAEGSYNQQINLAHSENEFVELAQAFNQMSKELTVRFRQNQLLLDETENQAERLQVLNQISRAVSSTLDLDSLYVILENELSKIINFDGLTILIYQPDATFRVAYSNGQSVLDSSTVGTLLEGDTPIELNRGGSTYLPDVNQQITEIGQPDNLGNLPLRSQLMIPIRRQGQLLGLLILASQYSAEYSPEQVDLIEAIGVQLAIAIQNGRVYQQLAKAYEELEGTQRALKHSARQSALGEMAAGIAHDFNNLVTTIMGCTQLLQLKLQPAEPEDQQLLNTILSSSMDAAAIISRISEFGRQRQPGSNDVVDLNEVVKGTVELTRPYWLSTAQRTNSQVSLSINLNNAPALVVGNLTELREVLTNLIVNAVDAMPQGGELSISTRAIDDRIELAVKDTGAGMSEEVKKHIFEAFYSTKGEKGSGLGLAVSYGIISQYNGQIEVESEPGQGSTFRITLPRKQKAAINTAKLETSPNFKPNRRATILVVDDEPNVRKVLTAFLRKEGFLVEEARDGLEALKALMSGKYFELVLSDLGMPVMGGLELAAQMRQHNLSLPFILVTGWSEALDEERRKALGIQEIVAKPFDLKQLLKIIDETLKVYGYSFA